MSRTELWEAPKGAPLTGHVRFTVDADEHVRIPYTMLASILQNAGIRRKITTDHDPRLSLHPTEQPPAPLEPPAGFRWMKPSECHGTDNYCTRCSPESPERRVTPIG